VCHLLELLAGTGREERDLMQVIKEGRSASHRRKLYRHGWCAPLSGNRLLSIGRRVRAAFMRCGAQRPNHSLVILDAERRRVTTCVSGRHTPSTEARTYRSTWRGIVEDHAVTLSG
jgi:hypothetical protein